MAIGFPCRGRCRVVRGEVGRRGRRARSRSRRVTTRSRGRVRRSCRSRRSRGALRWRVRGRARGAGHPMSMSRSTTPVGPRRRDACSSARKLTFGIRTGGRADFCGQRSGPNGKFAGVGGKSSQLTFAIGVRSEVLYPLPVAAEAFEVVCACYCDTSRGFEDGNLGIRTCGRWSARVRLRRRRLLPARLRRIPARRRVRRQIRRCVDVSRACRVVGVPARGTASRTRAYRYSATI